jgi:dephospho-CoA kinase
MAAAQLVVGLTGGIGSGKSTAAGLFAGHGAGIVDTDQIAHLLTRPGGAAIAAIRAEFGQDYIAGDGALERARMRRLIFSDAAARHRLESILHPLILEQAKALVQQLQDKPYIILVVPLLAQSPAFRQLVRRTLVVDCDEATQVARVTGRGGMDEAEARVVIAQQTPRAERLKLADDVIHNQGGLDSLAAQVAVLHQRYAAMQNSN